MTHRFSRLLTGYITSLFISALLIAPSVTAQDTLTPGEVISGSLAAGERAEWSFIAQDGQLLSFEALAANGSSLDPVLQILDRNGNPLLTGDDIDYPGNLNAAIEGFSAPGAGSYTLVLTGYGETSGDYDVSVQPGYTRLLLDETFEAAQGWNLSATATDDVTPPELMIRNGALTLSHRGIAQNALATGTGDPSVRFYAQVTISDIDHSDGWRAGLALRHTDAANYYQLLVNHRGAWQFARIADGERTLIRDWTLHPAIVEGETEFTLGVLVNGTGYDIFYNGQFIGAIQDRIHISGNVGLLIRTPDSAGNDVQVDFDRLKITIPSYLNKPPAQLVAINNIYTARELERRGMIIPGGRLVLTIAESSTRFNEAGVSRVTVARELEPRDFVLGANVTWDTAADAVHGCGLVVRDAATTDNYVLAYVDNTGGYGLALRQDERFATNLFDDVIETGSPPHELIVIGAGNEIHYYLNRQYVGMIQTAELTGNIGEAVVNFDPENTNCRFDDLWLWEIKTTNN